MKLSNMIIIYYLNLNAASHIISPTQEHTRNTCRLLSTWSFCVSFIYLLIVWIARVILDNAWIDKGCIFRCLSTETISPQYWCPFHSKQCYSVRYYCLQSNTIYCSFGNYTLLINLVLRWTICKNCQLLEWFSQ